MRNLYCSCGELVATLETGSTIKRGTILICRYCANAKSESKKDNDIFSKSLFGSEDGDALDKIRSMFGIK